MVPVPGCKQGCLSVKLAVLAFPEGKYNRIIGHVEIYHGVFLMHNKIALETLLQTPQMHIRTF